jgi:hypothetical protein
VPERTTTPGTDLTLTVVNEGLRVHDMQVTPNGDGTTQWDTLRG